MLCSHPPAWQMKRAASCKSAGLGLLWESSRWRDLCHKHVVLWSTALHMPKIHALPSAASLAKGGNESQNDSRTVTGQMLLHVGRPSEGTQALLARAFRSSSRLYFYCQHIA